jgi:hypothetical protein
MITVKYYHLLPTLVFIVQSFSVEMRYKIVLRTCKKQDTSIFIRIYVFDYFQIFKRKFYLFGNVPFDTTNQTRKKTAYKRLENAWQGIGRLFIA